MKNRILTVLVLSAVAASSFAQPASAGGMAPAYGERYGESAAEATAPAQAGMDGKDRKQAGNAERGESKTDLEITARIRRAVVADESLSMYAHNIKIYTRNGHVTLKGAVRTQEEKQVTERMAEKVAGKGKVTNKLQIKPKE